MHCLPAHRGDEINVIGDGRRAHLDNPRTGFTSRRHCSSSCWHELRAAERSGALRRGHVAAQRGRQDAALGRVLSRRYAPRPPLRLVDIGKPWPGSESTQKPLPRSMRRSNGRQPTRPPAWRADALVATGDRVRAADPLDRLTAALDANGRQSDALDTARRALDSRSHASRRDGVKPWSLASLIRDRSLLRCQRGPSRALGMLADRVLGRGPHPTEGTGLSTRISGDPGQTRSPSRTARRTGSGRGAEPPPRPIQPGRRPWGRSRTRRAGDATAPASWPRPAHRPSGGRRVPRRLDAFISRWRRARPIAACTWTLAEPISTSAGGLPRSTSWSSSARSRSPVTTPRPAAGVRDLRGPPAGRSAADLLCA